MRRRVVILVPVLVCAIATALAGQAKLPASLTVTVDKAVVNLYETVTGKVDGLGPGEKFTVELVDAYGQVMTRGEYKRTGFTGTPFRLQVRTFSTPAITVQARGASERTGLTPVQCVPPTAGWESVVLVTGNESAGTSLDACKLLRLFGIQTGLARSLHSAKAFNNANVRTFVLEAATVSALLPGTGAAAPGPVPLEVPPALAPEAPPAALPDVPPRPREAARLKRSPCLAEPGWVDKAVETFSKQRAPFDDLNPLGYVLGSAPGVTLQNRALDVCFDESTLVEFREWLKKRYASPAVLSRDWGEKFRRWEDVVPSTTAEILAREFKKTVRRGMRNFSPWMDHRTFMDETFGTRFAELTGKLRLANRGVRIGFLDGQAPAAFGGYDWTLLAEAADFMECADPTFKRLAASLNRQRVRPGYMIGTVSDRRAPVDFISDLWKGVADGDLGIIIEPGTNLLDPRGLPTPFAFKVRSSLVALETLGHVIIDKDFVPTVRGVRVYYSPPSVRVQYLLDAGAMGNAWQSGSRSDDIWMSTWHRNMLAWVELLDDLGVEFEFLSHRKVTQRGWTRDVSVIILPKTVAMSKEEADALRDFVERGGLLIADSQTGIFDEHGVERDKGVLDVTFGVKREGNASAELAANYTPVVERPLKLHPEKGRLKGLMDDVTLEGLVPVEPNLQSLYADYHLETGRTHALITRSLQRGSTVYLNLSLMNYPWERKDPAKVAGLRTVMRRLMGHAGVAPVATAEKIGKTDLPDLAIRQYRHRNNDFLFVLRRPLPPVAPPTPRVPVEPPPEQVPPGEEVPPVEEVPPLPLGDVAPPAPLAAGPMQFHQVVAEPPPADAPAPPAPAAETTPTKEPVLRTPGPGYRLKVGDVVGVEVAGREDLTRAEVVRNDGKITLPLIGEVMVRDFTAEEVDAKVTQLYEQVIVRPDVTVHVATPAAAEEEKPDQVKEPEVMRGDFFRLRLDRERHVYAVILGRYLGRTAAPEIFLPEGECAVLTLLDYQVRSVDVNLALRPQELTYRINLAADGPIGLHAYRVHFIDPKGKIIDEYTRTLAAPQGYAGGVFHLALNDAPGEWTVRVTDVLTGTTGEAKFTLK